MHSKTWLEHCILTGLSVRYRSGREVRMEIPTTTTPKKATMAETKILGREAYK